MIFKRLSLLSINYAFLSALFINIAIAGPVDDGGTLACSDETSKANINDIRFPGNGVNNNDYLEIYILEQDVSVKNWQLCYTFTANPGYECIELGVDNLNEYFYGNPQDGDANPNTFNTGTYLEYEVPNSRSLNPDEGEVLLVNNINGTDVVVDYIQYCQSDTCDTPYWNVPPACGFTLTGHDANNKDIARLPDGDGDFSDNGSEVTRGDTNDDSTPASFFSFTMDEPIWNGTTGEVIDPTGFTSGTAINGAVTSATDPAVAGTPGTCGYGSFDGVDDYIAIAPLNPPDGEDDVEIQNSITLTSWIQTNNNNTEQTIFSFQDGSDFLRLSVSPTGKLTYQSNLLTPGTLSSADGVIANDTWYFVSLVIDLGNNAINLYAATQAGGISLVASDTLAIAGGEDEFELKLESAGDLTIGGGVGLNSFSGFIDEFNLFGGPLNINALTNTKAITRPCAAVGLSHYAISHNGPGITCSPTTITITGHDAGNNPIAPAAGTEITLSLTNNTTGPGTWSGTDITPLANSMATYIFDGTQTSVDLELLYPQVDTININVTDGTYSETEDPDLVIGRALFQWSTINTQLSGKPSNTGFNSQTISLQALRASDNDATVCEPGFPNNSTVNVNLAAECTSPTSCAGQQVSITNNSNTTNIATNNNDGAIDGTTGYTAVPLLFGANATAELVFNYPDAGQMQLHALFESNNLDLALSTYGKSNLFVVRPFAFTISNINKLGTANPGGTATDGLPANGFVAAEDTFSATVTAMQWQIGEDANNDGIPEAADNLSDNPPTKNFTGTPTLSATSPITPAAGITGSLAGNTNVSFANTGTANDIVTIDNLSYNEVGSMHIAAQLNDYIASGINIQGVSESIGRFYPNHFTLTINTVTAANGDFSYMDQDFSIDYELEARGLNNSLTTNYDNTTLAYNGTAVIIHTAENNNDGVSLDNRLADPDTATFKWVNGKFIFSSTTERFTRSAIGPDGPYLDLQLGIGIASEVDSRNIADLDQRTNLDNDCITDTNCLSKAIGDPTDLRFGRINLQNTFGSELVALPIPIASEYFVTESIVGGIPIGGFFPTAVDNTTTYSATASTNDLQPSTLSNPAGNLLLTDTSASGIGTFISGRTDTANPIILSAPGVGNDGSVDISLDVPAYLEYDWNGDGNHDDDPTATATFGIYRGNNSTIYLRELY